MIGVQCEMALDAEAPACAAFLQCRVTEFLIFSLI